MAKVTLDLLSWPLENANINGDASEEEQITVLPLAGHSVTTICDDHPTDKWGLMDFQGWEGNNLTASQTAGLVRELTTEFQA